MNRITSEVAKKEVQRLNQLIKSMHKNNHHNFKIAGQLKQIKQKIVKYAKIAKLIPAECKKQRRAYRLVRDKI